MVTSPSGSFSASYDRTTKTITAVIAVALLIPVIAINSITVAVLAALLFLVSYAYSPRSYEIAERSIVVHRLIGNVVVPLEDLHEARPAHPGDFDGTVRLWGNGGLFGYYGLFRTAKFGKCWWYVTNRKNTVVVITARKTALFSPDDTEGFLDAVRAEAPASLLAAGPALTPRPSGIAGKVGIAVGVVVGLLAISFAIFAMTYSPGPPRYALTSSALTIDDRFYPVTMEAASVDVDHVRIVDLAGDPDWKPVARTNGFANSHYHSGWFRAANGQKVRMYWAEGNRVVLLPPKGNTAPVLLEVNEPERFVERIRREWGGSR